MKKRIFKGVLLATILLLAWSGWHYFRSEFFTESPPSLGENAGYFDMLRYVQARLRENPDHLPARYEAIIKRGTPEDLINFLRDRFEVIPPPGGWNYANNYINTGTRGALHGGVATPRELAELLANGLKRMGYESELVLVEMTRAIPPSIMSRQPLEKASFPRIDWKKIKDKIGGKPLPVLPPEIDTTNLWSRVKAAIPESLFNNNNLFPKSPPIRWPGVRFRKTPEANSPHEESEKTNWVIANLMEKGKTIFDQGKKWYPLFLRNPVGKIQLRLLVKTSDKPGASTVLEASFAEDVIAGAAIRVGFAPLLGDPQGVISVKPSQISRFQSFIKVEAGVR